ncbi:MAG TPA: hypothetical protein VKT70_05960, partial [Stellaceae bacterium]|nr:hypothetical protein [Stellaceae bacterium]
MAISDAYREASRRHYCDACHLANDGRFDSAGHLIGFAAECAIKHKIREDRPTENPPFCHIPKLIEKAKKLLHNRSS